MHGQSRKRNQEFLFQGADLEVTFLESFFHLTLYEQLHFLSVCGDCLRRSPGVTQVLRLSLSLSHTHSPSSKSDPSLYVSFSLVCLEKIQGIERLCRIQARTTALLNQQQAQLTDDRRIDMHGNPERLRLI